MDKVSQCNYRDLALMQRNLVLKEEQLRRKEEEIFAKEIFEEEKAINKLIELASPLKNHLMKNYDKDLIVFVSATDIKVGGINSLFE